MKEIKKIGDPKCNFCGKDAKYDCPVLEGAWAFLCEDCYQLRTTPFSNWVGFKFKEVQ